jgi:CheY-like chemotaxis protein
MSRTILLADDSLTIQKVVELTFADTEYEVVGVSSGDELLQRLPEVNPDLVICDVIMPGRDGYDVCQEIKSSSEHLHLPVILLTGTFEPFDRDRALAAGCSEIITKPFEARKLVDAVERLSSAAVEGQPPAAPAEEEAGDFSEVAPPPPAEVPERTAESERELELDDTEATREPDDGEDFAVGEPVEPAAEAEDVNFEFVSESVSTQEVQAEELEDAVSAEEEVFAAPQPDAAATLASADIEDLMSPDGDEPFGEPSESEGQTEAVAEDPFGTDSDTADQAPPDFVDTDNSLTSPIDVAAVMTDHRLEHDETVSDRQKEAEAEDPANADTQDLAEEEIAPMVTSEEDSRGLSDSDVDRIARRVLELAGDRIDHIAWDVIPDMAEIVVRERLREIEAAAEEN